MTRDWSDQTQDKIAKAIHRSNTPHPGDARACSALIPIPGRAQGPYEASHLYLGNYADEANPGWHENAQGLAHDRDNWFITQTKTLWKVPLTQNITSVRANGPGVIVKELNATDMLVLDREGYDHLGDPTYYEFEGEGSPLAGNPV